MSEIIVLVIRILMAAALSAFVGWAFYTLWRDLKIRSEGISSNRIPPLELSLETMGEENTRLFTKPEIIIGRDPTCDLCAEEDNTVSARHARLSYHHSQWWAEDLGSTNGTFLNQEPLRTSTVIVSGDQLRFGHLEVDINIGRMP